MRTLQWMALTALLGIGIQGRALASEDTGQDRAEAAGKELWGSAAPRMVLKTIDGDTIDLRDLYGKKAVYLKFWATWCALMAARQTGFAAASVSFGVADVPTVLIADARGKLVRRMVPDDADSLSKAIGPL